MVKKVRKLLLIFSTGSLALSFIGALLIALTQEASRADKRHLAAMVAEASGGRGGVSKVFDTGIKRITGLIIRGKAKESAELTGHEILAFAFDDASLVLSGDFDGVSLADVYGPHGINLTRKYLSVLYREIIQNAAGLYQSKSLLESGEPVKTLFVFFDPWCPNSKAFRAGPMPAWFEKHRVQLVWVPVSIFNGSERAGATFLDHGDQWADLHQECQTCVLEDLTPSATGVKTVMDNTKRLLQFYGAESIKTPLLVWLWEDYQAGVTENLGYGYWPGQITPVTAEAFLSKIAAIAPKANAGVLQKGE
jgi:hypothetical protein